MTKKAVDHKTVAAQYEKWVYPLPIMDLSQPEVRKNKDGNDPAVNYFTYWPDQAFRDNMDILVAGCGSNAAARYAFNHPDAQITGIDLSASSLAHENYLKEKHGLKNLSLHQLKIEELKSLGKTFDFIDVSGVLHHLPDPVAGLKALGEVLRPNGTIAIMVYGQYGRTPVYMLQEMFSLMKLGQTEEDVAIVKQTIDALPEHHAMHEYFNRVRDLKYDAGMVDTFLHRQDRAYTVAQCLDFVAQAGMKFVNWVDNVFYYPEGQLSLRPDLLKLTKTMSKEDAWQFMELFNGTIAQHSFCVSLPGRDAKSYTLDFTGDDFLNYIPVSRSNIIPAQEGAAEGSIGVMRPRCPQFTLAPAPSALYKQIDGIKTIGDCMNAAGLTGLSKAEQINLARATFERLWRISYIFLRLPPK